MSFADIIAAHSVEVGDCVEWTGAMGCGNSSVTPIIKTRVNGQTHNVIVTRQVWAAAHGPIPAGRIVYRAECCNNRCIALAHLKCGKRGEQLRNRARKGFASHSPATLAALTAAARSRSTTKYTAEHARAVRDLAAAGVPDILIAGATDVHPAVVADMRRGDSWKEHQSAGSVFSWRP